MSEGELQVIMVVALIVLGAISHLATRRKR
jgi:Sec-independent protein translocase protein TatA